MTKRVCMDHLTSHKTMNYIEAHQAAIEAGGTDEYWTNMINTEAGLSMVITTTNYQSLCKKLKIAQPAPVENLVLQQKLDRLSKLVAALYAELGVLIPRELKALIAE